MAGNFYSNMKTISLISFVAIRVDPWRLDASGAKVGTPGGKSLSGFLMEI